MIYKVFLITMLLSLAFVKADEIDYILEDDIIGYPSDYPSPIPTLYLLAAATAVNEASPPNIPDENLKRDAPASNSSTKAALDHTTTKTPSAATAKTSASSKTSTTLPSSSSKAAGSVPTAGGVLALAAGAAYAGLTWII